MLPGLVEVIGGIVPAAVVANPAIIVGVHVRRSGMALLFWHASVPRGRAWSAAIFGWSLRLGNVREGAGPRVGTCPPPTGGLKFRDGAAPPRCPPSLPPRCCPAINGKQNKSNIRKFRCPYSCCLQSREISALFSLPGRDLESSLADRTLRSVFAQRICTSVSARSEPPHQRFPSHAIKAESSWQRSVPRMNRAPRNDTYVAGRPIRIAN